MFLIVSFTHFWSMNDGRKYHLLSATMKQPLSFWQRRAYHHVLFIPNNSHRIVTDSLTGRVKCMLTTY